MLSFFIHLRQIYLGLCICVYLTVLFQAQHQSYDVALVRWALWAFTWSSGQVKNYWPTQSRYIRFTGFHVTIHSVKFPFPSLVMQVHVIYYRVDSIWISKKNGYQFSPWIRLYIHNHKNSYCKIKFSLWVLHIVHMWLANFTGCVFCIQLHINLILIQICLVNSMNISKISLLETGKCCLS